MNPWLKIPLKDYEAHMALPSVGQAEMLSDIFRWALEAHTPHSVAVLGCAGGNGFNRVPDNSVMRIVGIDINPEYIEQTRYRYEKSRPRLELIVADIERDQFTFEPVDLVFAGLLFEYVKVGKTLLNINPMLSTGGTLVAVLQMPSSNMAPITPTPYKALELLEGHMRLISENAFTSKAFNTGFLINSRRIVHSTGGKQFFVGEYGKKAEQKNEPDS